MKGTESWGLIVGVTVGMLIGLFLATSVLFCLKFRKSRSKIGNSISRRTSTVPFHTTGTEDNCTDMSDSTVCQQEDMKSPDLVEGPKRKNAFSASGIPKYSYKGVQKATGNSTALSGQGVFGSVHKAQIQQER